MGKPRVTEKELRDALQRVSLEVDMSNMPVLDVEELENYFEVIYEKRVSEDKTPLHHSS